MNNSFDDDDLTEVDLAYDEGTEVREQMKNERKKKHYKSICQGILSDSIYILVVLLLTFVIVKFVGQRTVVVGSSMNPTLYDGYNLIVDKLSYRFSEPERFDIIVFPFDVSTKTYYIKRIIGLPGETVRIDDAGNIYINGIILEENYGNAVIQNPGMAREEITLGEDQYFVLGDNRNNSSDSRTPAVGLIERENIIGRAWLITYPFSEFGLIKHGDD